MVCFAKSLVFVLNDTRQSKVHVNYLFIYSFKSKVLLWLATTMDLNFKSRFRVSHSVCVRSKSKETSRVCQ